MKTINLKIQDTQKTPKRINIEETQIGYIIIVLPETSYKGKQIKAARTKKDTIHTNKDNNDQRIFVSNSSS